jgi:hypothetical protein
LSEVNVLHLRRAAAGQFVIQVLPRAAERLPETLGLGPQPLAMLASGVSEQLLVKLVSICRDIRKQSRKSDIRAVAARTVACGSGRHEDRAR